MILVFKYPTETKSLAWCKLTSRLLFVQKCKNGYWILVEVSYSLVICLHSFLVCKGSNNGRQCLPLRLDKENLINLCNVILLSTIRQRPNSCVLVHLLQQFYVIFYAVSWNTLKEEVGQKIVYPFVVYNSHLSSSPLFKEGGASNCAALYAIWRKI